MIYEFRGEKTDSRKMLGVGESSKPIRAHRVILASASPVFANTLYGPMGDQHGPIVLPDVQEATFTWMLRFIYTGHIEVDSFEMSSDLFYVAHKYLLWGLSKLCVSAMMDRLSLSNVCRAYETAVLYNEDTLLKSASEFIQVNTAEVLKYSEFIKMHPESVASICAMEPLNINTETPLLEALDRYVQARPEMDRESTRSLLSPMLKHVRFLTLWPEDWQLISDKTEAYFTSEEINSLTAHIDSADCNAPLPVGVSHSRIMRKNRQNRIYPTVPPGSSVTFKVTGLKAIREDVNPRGWIASEQNNTEYREACGLVWELIVDQDNEVKNCAGIMVACEQWTPKPDILITILSSGERTRPKVFTDDDVGEAEMECWNWWVQIPWDELMNPRNGYVVDDTAYVKIDVLFKPDCYNLRYLL